MKTSQYDGPVTMTELGRSEKPLRAVSVQVRLEWLVGMLTKGSGGLTTFPNGDVSQCEVVEGVPLGAQIIAVKYDPVRKTLGLAIEHETFDIVGENDPIPDYCPTFRSWLLTTRLGRGC